MGRRLALPVGAWPPEPLEYVFTEGTASPWNIMYDDVEGSGPFTISSPTYESKCLPNTRGLVRTSDGMLYSLYTNFLAGKLQIYVVQSADEGATWTDDTRVSTYPGMENQNHAEYGIAVDGNDYLHVIWRGKATGFTTDDQVWCATYDGVWNLPVRVSAGDGMEDWPQIRPAIAVDSSDNLHVVWSGRADGYVVADQVWYSKYTGSWSVPTRLSTVAGMSTQLQRDASVSIDSANNVHVVWEGRTNGYDKTQIWYTKYTDSWSAPIRISTGGGMEDYPQGGSSIAIDSIDNLHAIWQGKNAVAFGIYHIFYSKYNGGWSVPVYIDSSVDGNHTQPTIAVSSGDIHVIWNEYINAANTKIWYNIYTDAWAGQVLLQAIGKSVYSNIRWSRWPR